MNLFSALVIFCSVCALRSEDADVYDQGSLLPYEDSTQNYKYEYTSAESATATSKKVNWEKVETERIRHDQRSYDAPTSSNTISTEEANKISLKEFLEKYAQNLNKHKTPNRTNVIDDGINLNLDNLLQKNPQKNKEQHENLSDKKDKSKSWALLNVEKHKNHFNDERKKGWVSMEPIPWSLSKISKWHSKYKPTPTPYDHEQLYHGLSSSTDRPWENEFDFRRPTVSITPPSPYLYNSNQNTDTDRFDLYGGDYQKPKPQSIYPRPSATFGHKVHLQTSYGGENRPSHQNTKYCNNPGHYGGHSSDEIMTDGRPSNFPTASPYDHIRRRGSDMDVHPDNHPFTNNGEWVLLSTTKGYKPPKNRQRSLDLGITPQPIVNAVRAHKSIKLTVLPPLKNSKVNMTTSHGGLLQVDSTFESVEEAKEKHDQKKHMVKIKNIKKRRKGIKQMSNHEQNSEEFSNIQPIVTSVPRGVSPTDPAAVIAAIGAGMIPATMAMMVPFAMSGRRKRSIPEINLQIPMPREYF